MYFFGRKKEIALLLEQFDKKKSCSLIYGKRRVGKTTLILEAAKSFDGKVIYYECLKSSMEDNARRLFRLVQESENNEYLAFNDVIELFEYLKKTKEKYLIIIDEYQYLKNLEAVGVVDSMFQQILDFLGDNIHVVLSGSYIAVMKELLNEDNPLFGRFTLMLDVKNMNYLESSLFYSKLSYEEKVKYYCVFGGNPYANANLDIEKGLEYNIKNLVLKQTGILRNYMESVFLMELNKANNANKILLSLSNGRKKYSELESYELFNRNGLLDKNLKILLNMEIIEKSFPINFPEDRKKSFYSISDNFVRFYYTFIAGNVHYIQILGEDAFYKKFIEPNIWQFISLRFEDIAKEYFIQMIQNGMLEDVMDVGRFWYNNPDKKQSGEFDVVLRHFDGSYSFFEVKCYKSKVSEKKCIEEEKQIRRIDAIQGIDIKEIGFVALNGFDFVSEQYKLLSGDELFPLP